MSLPDLPETCLGAKLVAPGQPLEISAVQMPDHIEDGALLVQMDVATICGSDVHLAAGEFAAESLTLPMVLGHEMVGCVVAKGRGTDRDSAGTPLEVGDRVIWEHEACGHCHACTIDRQPELCTNRKVHAITGCTEFPYLTGGFAQYGYVRPRSGRIRVPDEVDSAWASAASCALRTVLHAFERLGRVTPWETLVIQGDGPLGLFATAVARRAGVGTLIVIGGGAERLAVARAWGADATISVLEHDADARRAQVLEVTEGSGADTVLELSGARGAFREGFDLLRPSGRFVVVGQVGDAVDPIPPAHLTRANLSILGSWSGTVTHYWQAMEFLRRTRDDVDYDQMISGRYALEDINTAMRGMRDFTEIKAAVLPNGETTTVGAAAAQARV